MSKVTIANNNMDYPGANLGHHVKKAASPEPSKTYVDQGLRLDFVAVLPTRAPDFVFNCHEYFTKDGECLRHLKFWFEEGVFCHSNKDYGEDYKGYLDICPLSGALMMIQENNGTWQLTDKVVNDFYQNYLAEKALMGE
jgi:hypothetical protein